MCVLCVLYIVRYQSIDMEALLDENLFEEAQQCGLNALAELAACNSLANSLMKPLETAVMY